MSIICKCLFLYELALTILSLVLQDHDALLCVEVIKQCLAPIEGHNNLGRVRVYKGNRGGSAMFWKTDRQWVRGTKKTNNPNAQGLLTFLLVENRHTRWGIMGVPDPHSPICRAGGQTLQAGGVDQTPHRVLMARQHTALHAWIWTHLYTTFMTNYVQFIYSQRPLEDCNK